MAYSFSKIEFYRTLKVGTSLYTENGLHRCMPNPTPDNGTLLCTVDAAVVPKNGDIFTYMHIPMPKDSNPFDYDLTDPKKVQPSFMRITFLGKYLYGWIDEIRCINSTSPNTSFGIRWHIDWWLTSGNLVTYGTGRLLRGSIYKRPDPSEPIRWMYSDKMVLSSTFAAGGDRFVLVIYQKTDGNNNTSIEYLDWKIGETITSGGNTYQTMSIGELYSGLLEEKLGIDPDTIIGCWIAPFDMAGTSTSVLTHSGYAAHIVGLTTATYINNVTAVTPGDNDLYIVTDQNGQRVGEVGWGCTFDKITVTTDAGCEGCRIRILFEDTSKADWIGEGRVVEIPAIPVPVTSNAWSSYVYSGQREYDRTTARINQEKQLVNSISGIGTSAIGGAIAGSMVAPGAGTAAGAIAGVISGTIGAGVNYFAGTHYDEKTQEAVDRLKASQTGNIVMGGGGPNWLRDDWYLVHLIRDTASAAMLNFEQTELGYLTDVRMNPVITALMIAAKGGLKIEELEVSGIRPEGCRYISEMFARGVHLD